MCSAAACSWLSPVPTASTCAALPRTSSAVRILVVQARPLATRQQGARGSGGRGDHLAHGDARARRQAAAVLELRVRAQDLAVERGQLHAHGAVAAWRPGKRTREHHAIERAAPQTQRRRVAKNARSTAAAASGGASAETSSAGRPFFIRIGVDQTSTAPAADSASVSGATSCGLMSSMFASSSTTSRRGGARRRRPAARPTRARSTLARSASSRRAGAVADRAPCASAAAGRSVDDRGQDRGAGRRGQLALAFGQHRDRPRSSAAVAGAGTGTGPCAVRTRPVPTTGGNEPIDAGAR